MLLYNWSQSIQSARLTLRRPKLAPLSPSSESECVSPPGSKWGGGQHSLAGKGRWDLTLGRQEKPWLSIRLIYDNFSHWNWIGIIQCFVVLAHRGIIYSLLEDCVLAVPGMLDVWMAMFPLYKAVYWLYLVRWMSGWQCSPSVRLCTGCTWYAGCLDCTVPLL